MKISKCLFLLPLFLLNYNLHAQMRQVYVNSSDPDNEIYKISFYSPSSGYVVFRDFVGFTSDSGRTYSRKVVYNNVDYYGNGTYINISLGFSTRGIKAFSKDTILTYGEFSGSPTILYSVDGGVTFKLVYQYPYDPQQPTNRIWDMEFPGNSQTGYAIHFDQVLKTTNKGHTWTVVNNSHGSRFNNLDVPDVNTIYVSATEFQTSTLVKSSTGGAAWQNIPLPAVNESKILGTCFNSGGKGWINMKDRDYGGYIYRTTDGGNSWTLLNDPVGASILCGNMSFVDDSTGYTLGAFYTTLKTVDGGKIWEVIPRDNNFSYLGYGHNQIFVLNKNQLWAGGGFGFLELNTNPEGPTIPRAQFKIDTTNYSLTGEVRLVNFSKPSYKCKWYVNNVLISTEFNTSYTHDTNNTLDSVKLVIISGTETDSIVHRQYFPVPIIVTSFTPTEGATGTAVIINGKNFSGASAVYFGGVMASSFTILSAGQIRAIVDSGATGTVTVVNEWGAGSLPGFTYFAPPRIDLTTTVSKYILCKSERVTITLQNTEIGVRYELIDSLNRSYGSVVGNGGTSSLLTLPITISGNYFLRASRLNVSSTRAFTKALFFLVEHTKSDFTTNQVNAVINEPVNFYQCSVDANTYEWRFPADASIAQSFSPAPAHVSFSHPGQKEVTLISTGPYGCKDTLTANTVYAYTKPQPDDVCYLKSLDSLGQNGHDLLHLSMKKTGGFLITGHTSNPSTLNSRYGNAKHFTKVNTFYIADYTTDGALNWTMQLANDDGRFTQAITDNEGNIYVAGVIRSTKFLVLRNLDSLRLYAQAEDTTVMGEKMNGFLLKLDGEGKYMWHKIIYDPTRPYTGTAYKGAYITKMAVANGEIAVIGNFFAKLSYERNRVMVPLYDFPHLAPQYNQNCFILKLDGEGSLLWNGMIKNEAINGYKLAGVTLDRQGNTVIAGYCEVAAKFFDSDSLQAVTITGPITSNKGYLVKFDTKGKVEWYNRFDASNGTGDVALERVLTDSSSNLYVTGGVMNWGLPQYFSTQHSNGSLSIDSLSGFVLLKFDSTGRRLWGRGSQYPYYGSGTDIVLKDNDLYATGAISNNNVALSTFSFTSASGIKRDVQIGEFEFFIAHYDLSGELKSVATSGDISGGRVRPKSIHVDSQNNFYIGGNLEIWNGGTGKVSVFGMPASYPVPGDGFFLKLNAEYCTVGNNPVAEAGQDRTICAGDSTRVGVNVSGARYVWSSIPEGFSSTDPNPMVRPLVSTTYYLTLTSNTGVTSKDSVRVTTLPAPPADAGPDRYVCQGKDVVIGTTGAENCRYSWTSSPAGFTSSLPNPTVAPVVPTTYYLEVKNDQGCTSRAAVTLNMMANFTPDVLLSGPATVCEAERVSFGTTVANGGDNPVMQWQLNGQNVGSNTFTFSSSQLKTGDQLRVILTSSLVCVTKPSDTSNVVTITVAPAVRPTVSIESSATNICSGTIVTFQATAVNAGTSPTYTWQINGTTNVVTGNSNFSSAGLRNNDKVTVMLKSSAACAVPDTASSNVIIITSEQANAGPDKAICAGSNAEIGSPAASGYIYTWSPGAFLSSSSIAQPLASPASTTHYVLTVTSPSGCVMKDTVVVAIVPLPPPPAIALNGNTLTSSAATGNQWYRDNQPITGATSPTYVITQVGSYSAKVTINGCSSTFSNVISYVPTSISPVDGSSDYIVAPNPVQGKLYVAYKGGYAVHTLNLFDVSGRQLVKNLKFYTSYTLDMKDFSAGSYILVVSNNLRWTSFRKILIKQ